MLLFSTRSQILWGQVLGLASVQGAITLAWIIYGAYLPKLLQDLGLPLSMGLKLLIIESALAVLMEPVMGGLSDRSYQWVGSRFPFIAIGVVFSSALFMIIPAVVIFGSPTETFRWLLIGVLVLWSLAMTVFRSPAIALLAKCSTPKELPLAVSVVTLVGGFAGAFRPVANSFLLNNFPPMAIFALGSFILLGAAAVLRSVLVPEVPSFPDNTEPYRQSILIPLMLISIAGTLVGGGTRFLMDALGKLIKLQAGAENFSLIMVIVGIVLALLAVPAGTIATRFGNQLVLMISLMVTGVGLVLMGLLPNTLWLAALFVIPAFSAVMNSAIPWILHLMPSQKSGLGIGSYFGGFSAAMAIFGLVFPDPAVITPLMGAGYGALALGIATACVKIAKPVVIYE